MTILILLLIVTLMAFFYLDNKVKFNNSKHSTIVKKSLQLINEIDKAFVSDYSILLTPNTYWALSVLKAHALSNVVKYKPNSGQYKRVLRNLEQQNLHYKATEASHRSLMSLSSTKVASMELSLIPKIVKLRKTLRSPAIRQAIPGRILLLEDQALAFLMLRINTENLINKTFRAMDIGHYGSAKHWVNEIEKVLSRNSSFPEYCQKKYAQLKPLKKEIDAALYQPPKVKSVEEARREEEWDMIFNRKKRLVL